MRGKKVVFQMKCMDHNELEDKSAINFIRISLTRTDKYIKLKNPKRTYK